MEDRVRRHGRAVPSWTLLGSVTVVAVAVLAFLITASPDRTEEAAGSPPPSSPAQTPEQEPVEPPATEPADEPASKKKKKADDKAVLPRASVEVYNNSGITGLAATAAADLGGAGWDVVATDNWYGDIPQSTVYYPQRLRAQAALLADDLGTTRVMPAVDPMRFDRLTVILTGDL